MNKSATSHNRTQHKDRIAELEAEVTHLKTIVRQQADLLRELQCRVDPYCQDGEAICNSFFSEKGLY